MKIHHLHISDPVAVGRSRPHETRWGHFQFPSLCRLPDRALMATVSDAEDATCGYALVRCQTPHLGPLLP